MKNSHHPKFHALVDYLCRVPAVEHNETPSRGVGSGDDEFGWWVKFSIDIEHPLAWNVVQELGHVLNYVSVTERLPTVFKPVSPPPYLNGGPRTFLSWVIECNTPDLTPDSITEALEGRMPRPVDDLSQWTEPREGAPTKPLPRIVSAEVVIHGIVKLVFDDGYEGVVDLRPIIAQGQIFTFLESQENFRRMHLEEYGHHISWVDDSGNEIDFGADKLRRDCEQQADIHQLMTG